MILVGIPGHLLTGGARDDHADERGGRVPRPRFFGSLGTSSSLLMLVGTLTAGAVGGLLGPIALLNFQGGAYVVAGVFVLLDARPEPRSALAIRRRL